MALEDGLGEVEAIFQLRKRVAENPDAEIARARLTLIEGMLNSDWPERWRWFVRSPKRDGKHYISHAATQFAILAFTSCGEEL